MSVCWTVRDIIMKSSVVSWLRSAPVMFFGSSSVFQFLFGYLGRCSCSFISINTLSAWHYDSQVCSRCWSRFNEYFDEFDCRTCLWSFGAELDFDPAGFTVVATMPDQHVALVVEVAISMPNRTSNLDATPRFLTLLLTGRAPYFMTLYSLYFTLLLNCGLSVYY